jgi:hypothetical protein
MTADTGKPDWHARAERVAEQVLSDVMSGIDALPAVSLLKAVLHAEVGELPADETAELDEYFRRDEGGEDGRCICPPDLLARGGFRCGCPVHSSLLR